ncbi:MAG TPA: hypothetical protein VFL83_10325 [Anaeromyxobacter sp.]|nr:hypothetical protein [Anaeromyxobacter sp.]
MNRRTATFVWAGMLVVPFAFLGVAFGLGSDHAAPELASPLLWAAVVAAAGNATLAWVLPRRLGPVRAHDRDAVAFTRALVSVALCEAAALAPVVAFMITGDVRLLAVLAAGVAAYVAVYPSRRRWEALRPLGDAEGVSGPSGEGAPRRKEAP